MNMFISITKILLGIMLFYLAFFVLDISLSPTTVPLWVGFPTCVLILVSSILLVAIGSINIAISIGQS